MGRGPSGSRWHLALPLACLVGFTSLAAAADDSIAAPPGAGVFIVNQGQWDMPVQFVARRGSTKIGIQPDGLFLATVNRVSADTVRHAVVRLGFGDATGSSPPMGVGRMPWDTSFFLGNDPARWRSGVPGYEAVRLRSPGVERIVRWGQHGLEIEARLRAGTDLEALALRVQGAETRLDPDGSLVVETTLGAWRLAPPVVRRAATGPAATPLPSRFRPLDGGAYGLHITGHDTAEDLVIQYGLAWSTYLGGSSGDGARCVGLQPDGSVTVAGGTGTNDFPVTPGAFDLTFAGGTGSGPVDIFVSRLDPTGSTLLWSTYLGGSNNEKAHALLVEPDGSVVLTGWASDDFPTTPGAYQPAPVFAADGFLARLDATGQNLIFSTFLGGDSFDEVNAIARHPNGHLVLVGITTSTDFPTTSSVLPTGPGGHPGDLFLSMMSATGDSLLYSTLLGGVTSDNARGVAVDDAGLAYITGWTSGADFPTTPAALFPQKQGIRDAFVSCVDMDTSTLVASTYFGGAGYDEAYAIGLDPRGLVVILGSSDGQSGELPTTSDAFDQTWNGFEDTFIAKLTPDLQTLVYSSYIGGVRRDFGYSMVVESSGAVVVAGNTDSVNFPTTLGAFQTAKATTGTDRDFFVYRLAPDGTVLHYSTYLGGTGADGFQETALAVDDAGAATIAEFSASTNFPTTKGSFDPIKEEAPSDAIIARLTLLPRGVSAYGVSTPGCSGPLTLGVTAAPSLGPGNWAVTCTDALPFSSKGLLAVSRAPLDVPITALGADVWVVPGHLLALIPLRSDDVGYTEQLLELGDSVGLVGVRVYVQAFWLDPCAPGGLSASNALDIKL